MPDEPERRRDDPARSSDEGDSASTEGERADADELGETGSADAETVGTGSYVAVSCVAAMGMLLVVLIVGLLVSRWIG